MSLFFHIFLLFENIFMTGHGKIWHGRLDIVISSNPEITDSGTDESNNGIILILEKRLGLLAKRPGKD